MAGLSTTLEERDSRVLLCLRGELDLAGVSVFRRAVDQAIALGTSVVVVDLRRVEFIDSSGLFAVIKAHERVSSNGARFVLVRAPNAIHNAFRVAMVDQRFEIVDSADSI